MFKTKPIQGIPRMPTVYCLALLKGCMFGIILFTNLYKYIFSLIMFLQLNNGKF